ncbi:MAG: hypothetical protein J6P60_05490, partial [Lachnospiraceae bacterium]|nr:hypothetical protein [Lachnospiraceae bacterium]
MNVIRLMLTELLLVLPMLIIGAAALAFLNRKKEKHQSCIAVAFLTGTGICMLCFAALVLVGALRGTAFATVYRWYLAAFCLLILLSLTLILFAKVVRSYVIMRLKALRIKSRWPFYAALFLLYLTLAGTYFLHSPLLENRFDLPERLATMEETGLLCGTDPLTGELTGVSFSLESAGKAIL